MRAVGKRSEPIPENETPDEQRARLSRKAKKMMFNENGVAYAPWISKQIDEDVSKMCCDDILLHPYALKLITLNRR